MINTLKKGLLAMAVSAAAIGTASAALSITNGDFASALNADPNTESNDNARDILISGDVSVDGWWTSANPDTFTVNSGVGTFGAGNHRGIVNIISDASASTGMVIVTADITFSDNVHIKVWGVNDSDAATSGIQWDGGIDLTGPFGNIDALDLRDLEQGSGPDTATYTGSAFTELLNIDSGAITFTGNNASFSFDLGATGYDQVIIGFGLEGAGTVDNLAVIPEPSTTFLLGAFGLLALRRRRK